MATPNNLNDIFAVIKPDQTVDTVQVTSTIYQELNENYNSFKNHQLVSIYNFSEDWPSWEVHPKGDEIVVLLSGQATFILDIDGEYQETGLVNQGDYVVVPKNVWHTAKANTQTTALFITPGEGTDHKGSD